jgi:hypothetical protein
MDNKKPATPYAMRVSGRRPRISPNKILVGPPGVEPGTNGLCVPLWLSPPLSGLWSGLSLVFTTCPYSLYTFSRIKNGSFARDRHAAASINPRRQQRFPRI